MQKMKEKVATIDGAPAKKDAMARYHKLNAYLNGELRSGLGGEQSGVSDSDKLEDMLTMEASAERVDKAIQNIDSELYGKSATEMVNMYAAKIRSFDENNSKIDGFSGEMPRYFHELGMKIFDRIKGI